MLSRGLPVVCRSMISIFDFGATRCQIGDFVFGLHLLAVQFRELPLCVCKSFHKFCAQALLRRSASRHFLVQPPHNGCDFSGTFFSYCRQLRCNPPSSDGMILRNLLPQSSPAKKRLANLSPMSGFLCAGLGLRARMRCPICHVPVGLLQCPPEAAPTRCPMYGGRDFVTRVKFVT
jgi:hypothetical protein